MGRSAVVEVCVGDGKLGRRLCGWRLLAVLGVVGCSLMLATRAHASSSFSWSGGSATTPNWSASANWVGGSVPSASGTVALEFPRLTSSTCTAATPTEACYESKNDLNGLTAESMQLDDGDSYEIWGNPITLESGGLTASPAAGSSGPAGDVIELPIVLGASQKWSIAGRSSGTVGEKGVLLAGDLSGSHALTADLSERAALYLAANTEVGPLTIDGANTSVAGIFNGFAALLGSQLNSVDGNAVNLSHIFFIGSGAVGPLVSTSAEVYVGSGAYPAERIEAASATFDSASELDFQVHGPGALAGTDYSQLASSGSVELGGASLSLHVGPPSKGKPCPSLSPGEQYTLVSTTGTLSGSFGNAFEGTEIPIKFASSCTQISQFLKITYNRTAATRTVTGTVIAGPSSTTALSALPSSATTNQSVTLTATVAASAGFPSGTVEFSNNGITVPSCASQPVVSTGSYTATCQTSFAASSSPEHLSAVFTPGAGVNLKESTSNPYELSVSQDPTTTALQVSSASPPVGSNVTYTARVSPRDAGSTAPTGSVEFLDGGTPIGSCASQPLTSSGTASCQLSYAAVGTHSIMARYLGDTNFNGSSSPTQSVTPQALAAGTETTQNANTPTPVGEPASVSLVGANFEVQGDGRASLKLDCKGGGLCSGQLALSTTQIVKKHGRKTSNTVAIGLAGFSIPAGEIASVAIHLNARGRALLKRDHGRLTARLKIEQASSETRTTTVHLIERSPHGHKRQRK
jgi:hypothetical protein